MSSFFKKINKINKLLTRLIKKKREERRPPKNKIRNDGGNVTTGITEIQRTVKNYCKQL